jgi:hypothetical protein
VILLRSFKHLYIISGILYDGINIGEFMFFISHDERLIGSVPSHRIKAGTPPQSSAGVGEASIAVSSA